MKKRVVVAFVSLVLGGAVFAVTRRRRTVVDLADAPDAAGASAESGLIVEHGISAAEPDHG